MLERILFYTNEEIHRWRETVDFEGAVSSLTYSDSNLVELKAFIGLLYLSGLQKTCKTNFYDLWSTEFGSMLYRATMSVERFKFLLRMTRFDDKETRAARRETDKMAPIRQLWNDFIANCTKYYSPASYCTIDEQLLSFRGRCPFKVYNGVKPDKYGIKIVMLNDARTYYMYTAEPYCRKVEKEQWESVPSYYVRKLSEPLHGSWRNITCDNWFSSIEIFDIMLSEYSLTMVGTLRKNKRQIPLDLKNKAPVNSSKFLFDGTKTLAKYVPKAHKFVLLLSFFHQVAEVDPTSQKPAIVLFYNDTKGGTDCFDHMCHEYSTARKTNRWPMRFWYGMLDQGGINAAILHNFNLENQKLSRRDFLKRLIHELIEPYLRLRLTIPNLRRDLRTSIGAILHLETAKPTVNFTQKSQKKQARCCFCPRNLDRKVKTFCESCNRSVCEEHRTTLCSLCSQTD